MQITFLGEHRKNFSLSSSEGDVPLLGNFNVKELMIVEKWQKAAEIKVSFTAESEWVHRTLFPGDDPSNRNVDHLQRARYFMYRNKNNELKTAVLDTVQVHDLNNKLSQVTVNGKDPRYFISTVPSIPAAPVEWFSNRAGIVEELTSRLSNTGEPGMLWWQRLPISKLNYSYTPNDEERKSGFRTLTEGLPNGQINLLSPDPGVIEECWIEFHNLIPNAEIAPIDKYGKDGTSSPWWQWGLRNRIKYDSVFSESSGTLKISNFEIQNSITEGMAYLTDKPGTFYYSEGLTPSKTGLIGPWLGVKSEGHTLPEGARAENFLKSRAKTVKAENPRIVLDGEMLFQDNNSDPVIGMIADVRIGPWIYRIPIDEIVTAFSSETGWSKTAPLFIGKDTFDYDIYGVIAPNPEPLPIPVKIEYPTEDLNIDSNSFTAKGTATPEKTISLKLDENTSVNATVDSSGKWERTFNNVNYGLHKLTASDNITSDFVEFSTSSSAASIYIDYPNEFESPQTGDFPAYGTGVAGKSFDVFLDGEYYTTSEVYTDNTWLVEFFGVPEGTHTIRVVDDVSEASVTFSINSTIYITNIEPDQIFDNDEVFIEGISSLVEGEATLIVQNDQGEGTVEDINILGGVWGNPLGATFNDNPYGPSRGMYTATAQLNSFTDSKEFYFRRTTIITTNTYRDLAIIEGFAEPNHTITLMVDGQENQVLETDETGYWRSNPYFGLPQGYNTFTVLPEYPDKPYFEYSKDILHDDVRISTIRDRYSYNTSNPYRSKDVIVRVIARSIAEVGISLNGSDISYMNEVEQSGYGYSYYEYEYFNLEDGLNFIAVSERDRENLKEIFVEANDFIVLNPKENQEFAPGIITFNGRDFTENFNINIHDDLDGIDLVTSAIKNNSTGEISWEISSELHTLGEHTVTVNDGSNDIVRNIKIVDKEKNVRILTPLIGEEIYNHFRIEVEVNDAENVDGNIFYELRYFIGIEPDLEILPLYRVDDTNIFAAEYIQDWSWSTQGMSMGITVKLLDDNKNIIDSDYILTDYRTNRPE